LGSDQLNNIIKRSSGKAEQPVTAIELKCYLLVLISILHLNQ